MIWGNIQYDGNKNVEEVGAEWWEYKVTEAKGGKFQEGWSHRWFPILHRIPPLNWMSGPTGNKAQRSPFTTSEGKTKSAFLLLACELVGKLFTLGLNHYLPSEAERQMSTYHIEPMAGLCSLGPNTTKTSANGQHQPWQCTRRRDPT